MQSLRSRYSKSQIMIAHGGRSRRFFHHHLRLRRCPLLQILVVSPMSSYAPRFTETKDRLPRKIPTLCSWLHGKTRDGPPVTNFPYTSLVGALSCIKRCDLNQSLIATTSYYHMLIRSNNTPSSGRSMRISVLILVVVLGPTSVSVLPKGVDTGPALAISRQTLGRTNRP